MTRPTPPPPIPTPTPTPTPPPPTPTPSFAGKFGIPLETDAKLTDAKINVEDKGKANGFISVYIFKDADGYKTVAIFDSRKKANDNIPLATKINKTANEIKDFSDWCSNPKWIEAEGYFDCLQ